MSRIAGGTFPLPSWPCPWGHLPIGDAAIRYVDPADVQRELDDRLSRRIAAQHLHRSGWSERP